MSLRAPSQSVVSAPLMMRMVGLGLATLALCAAGAAQAQAQTQPKTARTAKADLARPFVLVEQGKGFQTLQAAVDAVGDGRGTIRIASGTHHQCAVQTAGQISYVAAEAGGAIFESEICEDKAALVLRGATARIDGVVFQYYRGMEGAAPHAAILWEGGTLSIVNSLFRQSDLALMASDETAKNLHISQSSFSHVGRCAEESSCTAGLAIGRIANLRLISSHFEGTPLSIHAVGVDVTKNLFEDGLTGGTLPLLSLPSGGVGRLQDNDFTLHDGGRGAIPLISVDKQEPINGARALVIKDNKAAFVAGVTGSSLFVGDGSKEGVSVGENHLGAGLSTYQRK